MSMEQMGGSEDATVFAKNQMQMELAKRHGEEMLDFIDKHAAQFGNYVKEHHEILETFKTDPEAALREIEKNIYH